MGGPIGEAIGQTLPLAVGVALSPLPIVVVVVMLTAPGGRRTGLAFLFGWVLGLAIAGTAVLLLSGGVGASEGGMPADWVSVMKLVLGFLLLWVAVRRWRSRRRDPGQPELPTWMRAIDRVSPRRATAIGAALSAANPKNLLLTVAAAAAIAQTGASAGDQAVALAVFVAIATLGPLLPLAIYATTGERAARLLSELRSWMVANNATIIAVLCILVAAKLFGDALTGISA